MYYTNLSLLADELLSLGVCRDFLMADSLLSCAVHLSMAERVELAWSTPDSGCQGCALGLGLGASSLSVALGFRAGV